ncbi:MAG: tripartite tricarboxylate transporter substrate binding protein [Oscillospiraceae bacterium]
MSKSKKFISAIVAIVMLMSVCMLSGCGSTDSGTTDGSTTSDSTASSTASNTASDYPKKNINVIVPFGAGGNTDMSTRALLNVASENLDGVTFVVDNKTGNSGLVGMEALADSDNDGYTIGAIAVDLELHICFGRTELTMDNFIPLAATMADPYCLIISSSNSNFTNLQEFVDYAKANPGAIKIGTSGSGTAPHLAALAFEKYLGIEFSYYTYDGSADCVTAIASGEIDATFTQPSPAVSQIEGGAETMIAVLAEDRLESYPDVPTVKETYDIDFAMSGWVVIAAPAGTPDDVVATLTDMLANALQTDEYKQSIENLGMQYMVLYGDELQQKIDSDMAFYQDICSTVDLSY